MALEDELLSMRGDGESTRLFERGDVDLFTRDRIDPKTGAVFTNTLPHTKGVITLNELSNSNSHAVHSAGIGTKL